MAQGNGRERLERVHGAVSQQRHLLENTQPAEIVMERPYTDDLIKGSQPPEDWSKLVCKLRWIGMEEEAKRLQLALRTLPPEQRGTVSAGPFSTD
jgi:hypothetical protein